MPAKAKSGRSSFSANRSLQRRPERADTRLRLAFRCRRISSAGRRIRQVLDLCPRIIEHDDCRLFFERNGDLRDARDLLDALLDHVRTGFAVHVVYRQRDDSLLRHCRAGGDDEQPEYQRRSELCHQSLHHEFSKGARKLNAIAATTNIVATTTVEFTNLFAGRVEQAVAHFSFDDRDMSQYPHPRHTTATAMKYG